MAPENAVDLTNCDREPIHLLGGVQSFGALIAVSRSWTVERVSTNIGTLLGMQPAQVLGRSLDSLIDGQALHDLRNRVALLTGADNVERAYRCELLGDGRVFDLALHVSGDLIILEVEPAQNLGGDAMSSVRSMIARVDRSKSMETFLQEGARLIRGLTGFDRVMVYRFDPDGSGEVVAEAVRAGIGAFKGMHYPASDIPKQARVLYKRNPIRIIADVDDVPARVFPETDLAGQPLDLSLSVLRSVSAIHIEYLKNMGVRASMSISIIVDDELWGLFACHHYAPKTLDLHTRSVCEFFAQLYALRLETRERKEILAYERRARDVSDQLLGAIASDDALLNDPSWLGDILMQAIPANGVGVWINGASAFSGDTPPAGEFRRLIGALNARGDDAIVATDHIGAFIDGAELYADRAAGMLAIPISRTARDYVVLFRHEVIRSVSWGGDPHKPVDYGPNGSRLTPRASFAEWKELVRGRSRRFTPSEERIAETLRATLIEVVLRMADEAASQRQAASERQELLIAELNHRVRNILGVIRGLIRQSKPSDGTLESFVQMVDGRIHALARAHNQITDDHWGPAPIQALIDAEAAAFLGDGGGDRVRVSGGFVLLNPQAYSTMALVFHELVTNSAKYGSLSARGMVDVSWRRNNAGDLLVDWTEAGGPAVAAPKRRGFGTTIIDRSVPYDLGGTASITYAAEGVRAHFCIPARHVSEASADRLVTLKARPRHEKAAAPDQVLADQVMFIVEDSLIIALDAEDVARKLGASDVLTAATVEAGLEALDHARPTIAMLDINLGDRSSFAIADRLDALGVPFVFASGYGEQAHLPVRHAGRIVVQKPYTIENVARAVTRLLGREDRALGFEQE